MGFLDSLNAFTEKVDKVVNDIADKLSTNTNNNLVNTTSEQNDGLEGLGNTVKSSYENACIESPGFYKYKFDIDRRKLATNISNFESDEQYANYIAKFLNETGMFNAELASLSVIQHFNFPGILYAKQLNNLSNSVIENNFCIFTIRNKNNLRTLLELIGNSKDVLNNAKVVVIGYCNYDDELRRLAKANDVDLVDSEGIREVNCAVDAADSGMPYLSLRSKTFTAILSHGVHDKYTTERSNIVVDNTMNNMDTNVTVTQPEDTSSSEQGINLDKSKVSLKK